MKYSRSKLHSRPQNVRFLAGFSHKVEQSNRAKRLGGKSRLLIYDSLFRHTHIVRKLTFLGVQKCGCVGIGYPRKKVIRARSLKNGSILYEDFELRNKVAVTFPTEGIFQNFFNFKIPRTHCITPAAWHNINLAGYRAVALTQTQSFSSVPPFQSTMRASVSRWWPSTLRPLRP